MGEHEPLGSSITKRRPPPPPPSRKPKSSQSTTTQREVEDGQDEPVEVTEAPPLPRAQSKGDGLVHAHYQPPPARGQHINRLTRLFEDGTGGGTETSERVTSQLRNRTDAVSNKNSELLDESTSVASLRALGGVHAAENDLRGPAKPSLLTQKVSDIRDGEESGIDNSSVDFRELKARFQRGSSADEKRELKGPKMASPSVVTSKPAFDVHRTSSISSMLSPSEKSATPAKSHVTSAQSKVPPPVPKKPNLPAYGLHVSSSHLSPTGASAVPSEVSVKSLTRAIQSQPNTPATERMSRLEAIPSSLQDFSDKRASVAHSLFFQGIGATRQPIPKSQPSPHQRPSSPPSISWSYAGGSRRDLEPSNALDPATASLGPPTGRHSSFSRQHTGNSVPSTTSSVVSSSPPATNNLGIPLAPRRNRSFASISNMFSTAESSPITPQISGPLNPMQLETSTSNSNLSTPSSTSPSSPTPPYAQVPERRVKKLHRVIQELFQTERTYASDMQLLYDIYYIPAQKQKIWDDADQKVLFSNLAAINTFEMRFLEKLQAACGPFTSQHIDAIDDDSLEMSTTIGSVFLEVMDEIDVIYCEYCKRQETAILRLQELEKSEMVQQFLTQCREESQGKTGSWDLGSLLIKPVQRVLKYPLLLHQLYSQTSSEHPDYENLHKALSAIQDVADHINEIKRRKDIVEKIVGDRRRMDVNGDVSHGINKTITRRAQRLKQVTGIQDATTDVAYDALLVRFHEHQEWARQLARDIQSWVRIQKDFYERADAFSVVLEELYTIAGGYTLDSVDRAKAFKRCIASITSNCAKELETNTRTILYPLIDSFLEVFRNPAQVMKKREKKLLDYDRVRGIKSRGEQVDKALQESANAYVSINAQLLDELPKFLGLTTKYMDIIAGKIGQVQAAYYKSMAEEIRRFMFRGEDGLAKLTSNEIVAYYLQRMEDPNGPLAMKENILLINRQLWATPQSPLPSSDTPFSSKLSLSNQSTGATSDYFERSGSFTNGSMDLNLLTPTPTPTTPLNRKASTSTVFKKTTNSPQGNGGESDLDDFFGPLEDDLNPPSFVCEAIYDYAGTEKEDISFDVSDILGVWAVEGEHDDDSWWWGGRLGQNEARGWFPSNYCQRLPQ
ncbi:hypothetical protein BZG36_02890 [Bifiguratus adelaidae]|uniref:Dynamin-binding protein n=1 Tax=Bifiguratus adelaidae TaxID=1938954 RepID=A0A261Y214_9FUNG|nr:hypothetical protein BZG36_02890 [Bifiguratus adelaidae]